MGNRKFVRTVIRFQSRKSSTPARAAASRLAVLIAGTVIAVAVMGCKGFFIGPAVSTITVNPSAPSIDVGQTQQLSAVATYANGSTGTVTSTAAWSSSASSTATVNASGLVKGVAAGSATITAELEGVSGTATVTVNPAGTLRSYGGSRPQR